MPVFLVFVIFFHIFRFNMANLPEETLAIPQAESSVDFNVVPKIMNNACVNVEQLSPIGKAHAFKVVLNTMCPMDKFSKKTFLMFSCHR